MPGLRPDVDPDGLLEYSVVYTDRALNHMSKKFQNVMNDISSILKRTYGARSAVLVPGGGSFGMEAVARQFATGKKCLVIRNGWFSYRWTQIFDAGRIPAESVVLKARRLEAGAQAAFSPPPIEEVVAAIQAHRPDLVFAAHVETASGIMLPDAYLQAVGAAVRAVGGMFVLDCVASGAVWVDMPSCAVDILLSAPQKGWSGPSSTGLVMLGERARAAIDGTESSSFAINLKRWLQIMETYEGGGHAYHATMPTDALAKLRDVMQEAELHGLPTLKSAQLELGQKVRTMLAQKGYRSVAAPGFEAPGVVVCYTEDAELQSGKKMLAQGLQIAAGVPLECDEGPDFRTFRVGLFGLDKLSDVDASVGRLKQGFAAIS